MIRLSQVLGIQSHKGDCDSMRGYIISELKQLPDVVYRVDDVGNVYAVKGATNSFPAFACHMDTHFPKVEGFQIKRMQKHIYVGYTMTDEGPKQVGIGGNGKAGVFLCLKLLQQLPYAKCVFYSDEGAVLQSEIDFYRNARWLVLCDRGGKNKAIISVPYMDLCSLEFKNSIRPILNRFHYVEEQAVVMELASIKTELELPISMVDISVGFWANKTNLEYVVEADIIAAYSLCKQFAEKLTSTSWHEAPKQRALLPPANAIKRLCGMPECLNVLIMTESKICGLCKTRQRATPPKCKFCKKLLFVENDICAERCTTCITQIVR